jgi:hypothetical protein
MLGAGYFHSFSSRFAASVVVIDNDRKSQQSDYQLPPISAEADWDPYKKNSKSLQNSYKCTFLAILYGRL